VFWSIKTKGSTHNIQNRLMSHMPGEGGTLGFIIFLGKIQWWWWF